jgi:hypothetical protein
MGISPSKSTTLKFDIVLNKTTAQELLNIAENQDMYLEECHDNKTNSLARRSMTYSANMIPLKDFNYARAFLESALPYLPQRLQLELGEIKIVQLMPSADGGMPHTRPGGIICFPDISQLFSKTTLIHELWHVHQRQYQDLWLRVFKQMGWLPWGGHLPEKLEAHRRFNPDTIDAPLWIYNDTWVPVPIFRDITHPNVGQVDIWFYNPGRGMHTRDVPSEIADVYVDLPASAYEHPREITAYILSEPKLYVKSIGYNKLIELLGHTSIPNAS